MGGVRRAYRRGMQSVLDLRPAARLVEHRGARSRTETLDLRRDVSAHERQRALVQASLLGVTRRSAPAVVPLDGWPRP